MDLRRLLTQPLLDGSFPLPVDAPFTYRQARAEGITSRNLSTLVDRGYLQRPVQGVYLATQAGDSPSLRAQCIRLVVPDDAIVCDRHAGWLLGAEMILAPNEHLALRPITVFRPSGRGRLRNGLVDSGERNLEAHDVIEVGGIPVTTPLRTACDLGRARFPEPAIAGLDAMLRLGAFGHDDLLRAVERFRGMRWVTTLRAIAPLADPRAASPGESVLRLRWIQAALPPPVPQHEVWVDGQLRAVLDLAEPELLYAAEYDGAEWHSSAEQVAHDTERREELTDGDWIIDPFQAEHVFGVRANADMVMRQSVARARRRLARRVRL
jgi:hypothetical protein